MSEEISMEGVDAMPLSHEQVELEGMAEKYVLKYLSPDEAEEFERHFHDCALCTANLRLLEDLVDGAVLEFVDQRKEK